MKLSRKEIITETVIAVGSVLITVTAITGILSFMPLSALGQTVTWEPPVDTVPGGPNGPTQTSGTR